MKSILKQGKSLQKTRRSEGKRKEKLTKCDLKDCHHILENLYSPNPNNRPFKIMAAYVNKQRKFWF